MKMSTNNNLLDIRCSYLIIRNILSANLGRLYFDLNPIMPWPKNVKGLIILELTVTENWLYCWS